MKHLFMAIAVVIGIFALSSASNNHDFGSNVGQTAPLTTLDRSAAKAIINQAKGKYLLINFWQSDDATSRMTGKAYDTWMRNTSDDNRIAYVSINLDENNALFEQIVRADNLDSTVQVQLTHDTAESVREAFGLQDAAGSILIDATGTVVAINPKPATIVSLIS